MSQTDNRTAPWMGSYGDGDPPAERQILMVRMRDHDIPIPAVYTAAEGLQQLDPDNGDFLGRIEGEITGIVYLDAFLADWMSET